MAHLKLDSFHAFETRALTSLQRDLTSLEHYFGFFIIIIFKRFVSHRSILILNVHSCGLDLAAFFKAYLSSTSSPAAKIHNVNVCPGVKMMLLSVKFDNAHIYLADKHVKYKRRV